MFRDLVSGQEQLLAEEPIIVNPDNWGNNNDILKMASLSSGTTAILYPVMIHDPMDTMDQLRINVVSIDNDSGQVISSSTLPFRNGYDVNLAALDNDKVLIQHSVSEWDDDIG